MAVAVATTQAATMVNATSVTVTKPTGLEVDDLMVAIVHNQGTVSQNIQLPSGWTSIVHSSDVGVELRGMYKVADSGDVAASNFTFSGTANSSYMSACIARVTGYAGNEIVGANTDAYGISSGGGTSVSDTCSLTPETDGSLIFMGVAGFQTSTSVTTSGYTCTGSLSFTEIMDTNGSNRNAAAAYATQSSASEITSYGATFSASQDDHGLILFSILNPLSADTTPTFVSSNQSVFAPTGSAGTSITLPLVSSTQSVFTPTGKGSAPTQWTNEAESNTTWTNEQEL